MAAIDDLKKAIGLNQDVPKVVSERIERGKKQIDDKAPERNECLSFWRGNQYVYRNKENWLVKQGVLLGEGGKPRHRVRTTRNLIGPIVRQEVAYATQRVPSYQINPSTSDPDDVSAAAVAQKVAYYGFDEWHVRTVTEQVVTYAVVADEGFAWPYWDQSIPPFVKDENGQVVGLGDVRIEVLGPNEVGWQPGVRFEDARWYIVRRAMSVEQVKSLPGYIPGTKVTPDASTEYVVGEHKDKRDLVMVTDYLERPCVEYPEGRRYCIANGKIITPPEAYPFSDGKGGIVDEPVLHKLSYILDPDSDRDQGLVRHLLDAQRTINDATNKQIEWKNLALMPQVFAPLGAFPKRQRLTDQPGAVFVYNPVNGLKPEWRQTPPIPQELSQLKSEALGDMQRIASQNDTPADASGRALSVLIERDNAARQAFVQRLAEFHSRLMRHCLTLVAQHYSEPRLIHINGRFGPESIKDFTGAQLRSQVDVTVFPESIEPRTRQALEQRVMAYADRGWVQPEKAMAAIEQGTAADVVDSYELDVARANRVIQRILAGPEVFLAEPLQAGPDGTDVPSWMPRAGIDNLAVHRSIFQDFAKTQEFELAADAVREAILLYLQGLDWLEAQEQQKAMMQQAMQAQQLGMTNAAKPQSPQMPDQRMPGGQTDQQAGGPGGAI
jgi:hypothetical protein